MPSMPEQRSGEPPAAVTVRVADEAALVPLAEAVVRALPDRAFVALSGDLGAGKTAFVKAVAAAAGLDPADVVSPTFGLIHVHPRATADAPPLVHADMYRLSGPADLRETGWEEAVAGPAWVFVEWPERIAPALPADRLDVAIAIDAPTARTFTLTSRGPIHRRVVARLAPAVHP